MKQDYKEMVRTLKRDIDLVNFLQNEGFEIDRDKTSRKWPALKHPSTGEKLIVSRNESSGEWLYFNRDDDRDRGSIVDYVARRRSLDLSERQGWDQLHQYVGNYQYNPSVPKVSIDSQHGEKITHSKALSQYFKLEPLTDTSYLTQKRYLSPETLQHPAFEKKIFNKSFTSRETGEYVMNTVFPLENQRGLQAILIKNDSPTGLVNGNTWGAKEDALWVSKIPKGHRPKEIIILENPIDALSYHQLQPPKEPFDRLYIATGGQPSALQPLLIQDTINKLKPDRVILANDNDAGGIRFNINYAGFLTRPSNSSPVAEDSDGLSAQIMFRKTTATLILSLHGSEGMAESIASRLQNKLDKHSVTDLQKSSAEIVTKAEGERLIKVDFPNTRPYLIRAEQFILEQRGMLEFLVAKRPLEKDWNESLKASLGVLIESGKVKGHSPQSTINSPLSTLST